MRKLWVSGSNPAANNGSGTSGSNSQLNQSISLGLMHLRKLFGDYSHAPSDDKVYNMLPLFCKVFTSSSTTEMIERFPEISSFTQAVSHLVVAEVRHRATNQSTEAAAISIINYLEESEDTTQHGWALLTALNLLSAGDQTLIDIMTASAVPSTLIKCLYLFFDLPEISPPNISGPSSDFSPMEKRLLLQKIFVQLLIRLCSYPSPAEQLAKEDDLALIFSAVTSWCPPHNAMWRKSAAEVLMTISTHGLTSSVLSYIHNKACIAMCIDNLRRGTHLTPLEVTEMVLTLFCFLKDSAELSQVLLDDFKAAQGYQFFTETLLKLEQDLTSESQEAIRNLVLVVASLTMCGFTSLRPNVPNSLFPLPTFQMPPPGTKGCTVRNLNSFNVLHSVFNKSTTTFLTTVALDSVSSILKADNVNYFILDSVLPQMAEKLHLKSPEVQQKYLETVEFVVFQLQFTPCKELIAISRILKSEQNENDRLKLACVKMLTNLVKHNALFKDVFREVGILEVIVGCLYIEEGNPELILSVIELLTILLSGNNSNVSIFRENNGSKCVIGFITSSIGLRGSSLALMQQLLMSQGGEEDMTSLLVTLHSSDVNSNIPLKIEILTSLITSFRESHRARNNFRKAGGFLYLMSVLVSMEGLLSKNCNSIRERMHLIQLIFASFALSMRFEPANAKLFHQEISLPSLADTVRLLGFLSKQTHLTPRVNAISSSDDSQIQQVFNSLFTSTPPDPSAFSLPFQLTQTIFLYRLLYDLATDAFDRSQSSSNFRTPASAVGTSGSSCGSQTRDDSTCSTPTSPLVKKLTPSLNLNPPVPEPIVVHSSVVIVMLKLIPSVEDIQCQLFCAELVKSLVRNERNQQMMAQTGLVEILLDKCAVGLSDESHVLHSPLHYAFERVATHHLQPRDLRRFMRLGNPLNCDRTSPPSANISASCAPVQLNRIKSLVSMTTPKSDNITNSNFYSNSSTPFPSFVEFDMLAEGFGCLYLPSVAPHTQSSTPEFGTNLLASGIGERGFPGTSGLSFSTWFCVDKFSDPRVDPHPVRILTIIKETSSSQKLVLCVVVSARDKALLVSTRETSLPPQGVGEWEPDVSPPSSLRVWCPELLHEGQWHHVFLTFSPSSFTLHVNGRAVHSGKLDYPSRSKGASYSAFIGTPPVWRKASKLTWRQGICHLFEDWVPNSSTIANIWKSGPEYPGNWQAVKTHADVIGPLIAEDKIVFGLNSLAVSQLTLAKIRKIYTKADAKAIAKQLGLSSHENATPISILHNSAAHLMGPIRCLGGVSIGYLGVRIFTPLPVAKSALSIAGIPTFVGLVAMATTGEALYASLKSLVCVVKSNCVNGATSSTLVDRSCWQMLGYLLKRKKNLLSMRVLHLVFSLINSDTGTGNSGFTELLGDLDIWVDIDQDVDLEKPVYDHFYQLLADDQKNTLELLRQANMTTKLLHRLTQNPNNQILAILGHLLHTKPSSDLTTYGHFVISTLAMDGVREEMTNTVELRNKCLQLIHSLMYTGKVLNVGFCEELIGRLGYDFILLFCETNIHPSSMLWALRILLLCLTSSPGLKAKFKDPSSFSFVRTASFQNVILPLRKQEDEIVRKTGVVGGWARLSLLLSQRCEEIHGDSLLMPDEVWLIICAMVLSQPCRNVSMKNDQKELMTLDTIWNYVFALPSNKMISSLYGKVTLCPDAINTLLTVTRVFITADETSSDIPACIIQFLIYLYSNTPEFQPLFTSTEILSSLASTVMPLDTDSAEDIEVKLGDSCDAVVVVDRTKTSNINLMNHPAKKIILDFLRMIIIDWMSNSNALQKNTSLVVDTVLEAGSSDDIGLITQFHTNLLGTLLDHLIAFDLDRMTSYLQAVGQFLCRLVDKLWIESFNRDPMVVFDFILVLVNHCRNKRTPPQTTDMIYNCLNRTVLFILSRRTNKWEKVEALKKLRSVRSVIFGSGNHQQEFFGCLVHVLGCLVDGLPISLEGANKTQWHVSHELDLEISSTAEKVWEDLFISKKPMVEDVFKITFQSPQPPPLSSLREQIGESANKLWISYMTSETSPNQKKPGSNPVGIQSWEIHSQLQSRLQKVTGPLTRLAGRSVLRKDSEKEKFVNLVSQWGEAKRVQILSNKHVVNIKENLESQERFQLENQRHLHRYVKDTLLPQLEMDLTRERGLWGPQEPCCLDKWQLDTTEGPCRMRKKLIKNDMFYIHYPFIDTNPSVSSLSSPKARRVNPPMSRDSKEFHRRFKHQPSLITDSGTSISSLDDVDDTTASTSSDPASPRVAHKIVYSAAQSMDDPFPDDQQPQPDPDNNSMLFRLINSQHEKISLIFRMAQITGLDTSEGLLLFGKDMFYLISGFTILAKTRDIKDMYYLPANMYEPILPPQCYGPTPKRNKQHTCWKFHYEDVTEVHKRRYLLQPIALEIFCSDGRNYLLAFPRKVRNVVYQKFISMSKNENSDVKQSVAGQRRTTSVESSSGIFSSLIGETSVTQRWVRGEISNFQYLMHLNTLAGRSYNDLMQYPVFPWILSNYDSSTLDLNDPLSFRDLGKPMGAQSSNRLVQFTKRYREWDDPHGETPPYHYGTHYSSAMIVCSYLVRMEPFAQHFLRLQGGHFDLADRMFHSIKEAWTSASKHNMADVKELIPEFFYLPEFLKNSNNFDLGSKQNGVPLGDVLLPPWAKNDPREFIRIHRMALECDYVSQHLHEWIDLIFGYKQQGPAAVEAVNVFHHLFYEGNVDIYTIDDPLKKNATIGFINNFGQIPKQLFKKPHPMKRVNKMENSNTIINFNAMSEKTFSEKLFYHHVDNLRPTMSPIKELKGPVGQIFPMENKLLTVEQNKHLLSSSKFISWGFADCSIRICSMDTDRPISIMELTQQQINVGNPGEVTVITTHHEKMILMGSTNTFISVWELHEKEMRFKSNLYGHTEAISCLACSSSYNIIVSGSKDMTCIVWDLARLCFVRQLVPHSSTVDAVGVNELTGDICTCDGSWLRLWSINGDPVCVVDTAGVGGGGGMSSGVLCVSFTYLNDWDEANVILTGSTDGIVRMWSLAYVQTPDNDNNTSVSSEDSEEHNNSTNLDVFDPDKDVDDSQLIDNSTPLPVVSCSSQTAPVVAPASPILPAVRERVRASSSEEQQTKQQNRKSDLITKKRERTIRSSKSETSLNIDDSFEILSSSDFRVNENVTWLRKLLFRGKLTMHTAYDRKDNTEPASITCISVSKDHKNVYVGDARGRVFSWSVNESGKCADHWVRDEVSDSCAACQTKFTLTERKHHCRNCGQLFCSKCSRFESEIFRLRILRPVRVCQPCFVQLKGRLLSEASN
ncbi:unnamed protein product [Allacma fusca]|uniref:WD repeat and FYVE domain-containing protein 3 n=1 Tax=Allacma fusca TaxID=39272 RepID=A0A8J2JXM1_9HEXA|nr:unnamed protein product [Allacma fusca]